MADKIDWFIVYNFDTFGVSETLINDAFLDFSTFEGIFHRCCIKYKQVL